MDSLQSDYQKALRCFLLTKYSNAMIQCVRGISRVPPLGANVAMEQVRYDLWTLLLNILAASPSARRLPAQAASLLSLPLNTTATNDSLCLATWNSLASGYNGPGNVNPRLVSAFLILTLKLDVPVAGKDAVEQWYACLPDASLDQLSVGQQQPDPFFLAYEETVELYVTRILPAIQDYESARSFVEYNPFLSVDKKQALHTMMQDRKEAMQRESQLALQKEKRANMEQQKKAQAAKLAAAAAAIAERAQPKTEAKPPTIQTNEYTPPPSSSASQHESSGPASPTHSEERLRRISQPPPVEGSQSLVKSWANQLKANGSAAYVAVLFTLFALLAMLRRTRLSFIAKLLLTRLWQTVQMGTKVTYM